MSQSHTKGKTAKAPGKADRVGEGEGQYLMEVPSCGNVHLKSIIGVLNGECSADALAPPDDGVVFVMCPMVEEVVSLCRTSGPTFVPLWQAVYHAGDGALALKPGRLHAVLFPENTGSSAETMVPLYSVFGRYLNSLGDTKGHQAPIPPWFKGFIGYKTVDWMTPDVIKVVQAFNILLDRYV
ncbi:hypothetical protein KIPB_000067 [Kipferlia bialata]|uniref:Uncharacterized protein n=1 Tax=Kipferlia bialata TaxID=797122 RepID=A0A9K3GE81_9EUKA|nr:hypothetical protein KIPB_000067 [Kipferlia bialata]|eukprot:g67.t1